MSGVNDQQGVNASRTCYFEKGRKSEVAVVLSCPGSREERNNRPASGTTGDNLNLLLAKLGPVLGLDHLVRDDVTVTNTFTGVEYRRGTGRSEASFEEILRNENISRLESELADISKLVIFCGARANKVAERVSLRIGTKFVCLPHLGMQGINQIKYDKNGVPIFSVANSRAGGDKRSNKIIGQENTSKRIDVLVELALEQFK